MARKARNNINKENLDIMKPISILDFGGPDDPCFGKLYDPQAPECKRCGDSEICQVAMSQNNHALRLEQEQKNNFKDKEEIKIEEKYVKKDIRRFIKRKIRKNILRDKIIKLTADKFNITKKEARKLIKKYRNGH